MNSENCKTYDPHRIRFNLTDKINLRRCDNCIALSNLSACYTWKNIKKQCKNNKFRISGKTWDQEFELPNGCYAIWDIQYYFEYIIKKHETVTDNPLVEKYASKIQNWVTFKIKFGYYLELLTTDIMKLLGNAEKKDNQEQEWWECTTSRKYWGGISSPMNDIYTKTFRSEFSYIELLIKIPNL